MILGRNIRQTVYLKRLLVQSFRFQNFHTHQIIEKWLVLTKRIALAGPAVDIANQTKEKSAYVKNEKSGELKIESDLFKLKFPFLMSEKYQVFS